jgi:hypothetical protein
MIDSHSFFEVVSVESHSSSLAAYLARLSSGSWTMRSARDHQKPMYRKEKSKGKCFEEDQGQLRSFAMSNIRDSS